MKTQLNKIETSNAEQDVFCYASGKRIYPNGYSMELRAIGADGKNIPGLQVVNFLLLGEKSKKYFLELERLPAHLCAKPNYLESSTDLTQN